MRKAKTILDVISERGKRGLPLERVYRLLFNSDLYLLAYGRIYRNTGAMTSGVTTETADGMSMKKIASIIEKVRFERYRWTPVRRVYIEKKHSSQKRPLGIPTWSDKLLQEVIRLILEAYYEPQFSSHSHGFRPNLGCHTALTEISNNWTSTSWFIEGDISKCFDDINHDILLSILSENIHDNRFLRLISQLLTAGYLEDWKYNKTLSGSPQGAVVSPILANIYLNQLDNFVEKTLLPKYNRGKARNPNPEYERLRSLMRYRVSKGRKDEATLIRKQMRNIPSRDTNDPYYRRLRYVRYADDFLLGFCGPREEAEEIKIRLSEFLQQRLELQLSDTKTLITHARTQAAQFLGYEIVTQKSDHKRDENGRRTINGRIGLKVPIHVIRTKCQNYMRHGKAVHRTERTHQSAFSTISQYQQEYKGIVEYYRLAYNLHRFNRLKWIMEQSLTKTLAHKFRITVSKVYDRFGVTVKTPDGPRKILMVEVYREKGRHPLVARWGGISLKRQRNITLNDQPTTVWNCRTELLERLLADTCELCGSQEKIEVHHIRHLKDLRKRGQTERPEWIKTMAARNRKTLIVCQKCHNDIHAGRIGQKPHSEI